MIKKIDVLGVEKNPIRVVYLSKADDIMVEFYDMRFSPPDGQFISRYYYSTLVDKVDEYPNGLYLYGVEPSWKVSSETINLILRFITYHYENNS